MSRSGYVDDCDDILSLGRWRAQVKSAMRGKRGQAFLRELADAMDAMPEKVLISNELINDEGDCCTIGVVCKTGAAVGIAHQMAAEIEYENDECGPWSRAETPEERWKRMRAWVDSKLKEQ